MPQSTSAKSKPRRRRVKRKNPSKVVKEFELQSLRKQFKRMMPKSERKYKDVTQAATTVTTTASVTNMVPMAAGTSSTTAIGNQFQVKSWLWRASITPNATAGVNYLRVILVRDKQSSGAAPAIADILESSTNYMSPLADKYSDRFKILFDKLYTVDTDANGAQVDKIYRKFNFKVVYDSASNLAYTNGLYLIQISDQATNGPSVAWYSRVRYIDD